MISIKQKIYNFLRWTEKYTKTDMVYLAKGGFWLTLSKIIGIIVSFLLSIAFANLLSKNSYGTYKYVLSIAGILSVAALPGLNIALSRAIAKGREGIIKEAIKTKIKWSFLGFLASAILAAYYFYKNNFTLGAGFIIVALYIPLSEGIAVYGSYLQGKKSFKALSLANIANRIFTTTAIITALFISKNPLIIILAFFSSSAFIQLFLMWLVFRKQQLNKETDSETINFGKHLSLMSIIGSISNQFDKIIMWHFFGATQLAVYSFSLAPLNQLRTMLRSFGTLSLPKMAEKDKDTLKRTLPPKILKFSLILTGPTLLYILLAPYLYRLAFPQYLEAVKYSQILALSLLFYPASLIGTALTAQAQKKHLYIIRTLNPAVKMAMMAIFIPLWGIYGAVASLLLSKAANLCILFILFKKMQ